MQMDGTFATYTTSIEITNECGINSGSKVNLHEWYFLSRWFALETNWKWRNL